MASNILLVFEGEVTEKKIYSSLEKYYLTEEESIILLSVYCTDIYSLFDTMKKDSYLDIFGLVKEKQQNKATLSDISRDDVSEVFLFFDYDGHDPKASDTKITEMLDHFDEETSNGKLYLSYPMVESLKHLKNNVQFKDVVVDGKNRIKYKQLVSKNCESCYLDFKALSQSHWSTMLSEHCKKLNHLITNNFTLPINIITQGAAFEMQRRKHIEPNGEVAVLCAFPIFIADYYGYSKLPSLVERT